jgi:2-(1,2-epoxy-1,2-dihydrophenyl)acetyl-CoA isomerase
MSDAVLYRTEGAVAVVTLNRAERMNTLSREVVEGAARAFATAADDDAVRVLILTGSGRAFCAGGDLQGMADSIMEPDGDSGEPALVSRLRDAMRRTAQLLHEMPKVTIAAINGACAGAGLAWACACDLRYAARSARFNTAFMTAGLSGDFGGTWTLPRIIGPARARELYLLAEKFDATEAERIGLVSATVPDEELLGTAQRIAARLASFAPLTLRAVKANLNDSLRLTLEEQMDEEARRHIRCGLTQDAREAMLSFLEKREPHFSGR